VLVFSVAGFALLYLVLRTQSLHPFNPQDLSSPSWDLSFNTAASFLSNTNWQYYAGETTLTNFSQMFGLAVQNFLSAAVGIAVLAAFLCGLASRSTHGLGNFYVDVTRVLLYILLPVSVIGGLFLASQGVLQSLGAPTHLHTLTGVEQTLVQGPVASQEAIKLLGTNGGGFVNVNSSMPFENPTWLTNFVEMLLILVIPAGLTATYGRTVGSRRQGWAVFATMMILFVAAVALIYAAETHGTPAMQAAGVSGPNMEGKEQRFGTASSSLFAAVTTAASCGAVNAAMESLTGLGGAVPTSEIMTGEVIWGGVGSGLYGMLLFVILGVFISGLMVGRTPEFLGKKVEAREIKLTVIGTIAVADDGAGRHRARDRQQVGRALDLRERSAGLLGDALRLHLAGQQQRLGLRRLHRLPPAQRHERGRVRDHLRQPARRRGNAGRALHPAAGRPRGGGLAGRQADRADRPRHPAHRHAHLRGRPDLGDRRRGAPDLRPCPAPRARGPGPQPPALLAMREIRTAAIAIVAVSLVFGLAYPLAMTGAGQAVFGGAAGGSLVKRDGKVVGSKLIGQDFSRDLRYFQSRPSATKYSASATFFNNLGPNRKDLADQLRKNLNAYLRRERLSDPKQVPSDAVTSSASGVDPDISEADARIQPRRVARRRWLARARVLALVGEHTSHPLFGLGGRGLVNVLELNLALDRESTR
jgi:K+-transporting ATPase KdpC subunit